MQFCNTYFNSDCQHLVGLNDVKSPTNALLMLLDLPPVPGITLNRKLYAHHLYKILIIKLYVSWTSYSDTAFYLGC